MFSGSTIVIKVELLGNPLDSFVTSARARSKAFATLRDVPKLLFWDKIGHASSVGFRFYSAI